jgi:Phytanoyl-CoA dioxygenase (PhyH)
MGFIEAIHDKVREVKEQGFCVLRNHFAPLLVEACRHAFWPRLLAGLNSDHEANRGAHRHFFAMPFESPIFAPEFFFDDDVLRIVRGLMDDRIVADQWCCDVPLRGSGYQGVHVDYQHPLFPEVPNLALPPYALVVSFGLVRVAREHGPIEIAPGTHRMARTDALRAVDSGEIDMQAVPLEIGDVLIRHPWALHRGTPNTTDVPRALATIRYVRRWYADASRDVEDIPPATWESLTAEQRAMMRFPQLRRASAPSQGASGDSSENVPR